MTAPLILTAELPPDLAAWATRLRRQHFPPDLAAWATRLRRQHFPPERNFLDAHVTLFHSLPPGIEAEIRDCCAALAREHGPVPARLEGVMKLGRGTALKLSSPAMLDLRAWLADRFHGLLMPNDLHEPRLHVTVQNKASIEAAKALQAELAPQIRPRDFAFIGLALHAYRDGPWEFLKRWPFRG